MIYRTKSLILLWGMMLLCIVPMFAHQVLPADLTYPELRFTETPPPPAPVRPVAEFEPASHVLIRYPLGIPVSLVVQLANTAQVICIVSSSQQNAATTKLFLLDDTIAMVQT